MRLITPNYLILIPQSEFVSNHTRFQQVMEVNDPDRRSISTRAHADQVSLFIADPGHPQPFRGDLKNNLLHQGLLIYSWKGLSGMHQLFHPQEKSLPQGSSRMEKGKVFLLESPLHHQRNRQGIPYRKGCCRACGRRQTQWAGLLFDLNIKGDITGSGQGGSLVAGGGDQWIPVPFDEREDFQ